MMHAKKILFFLKHILLQFFLKQKFTTAGNPKRKMDQQKDATMEAAETLLELKQGPAKKDLDFEVMQHHAIGKSSVLVFKPDPKWGQDTQLETCWLAQNHFGLVNDSQVAISWWYTYNECEKQWEVYHPSISWKRGYTMQPKQAILFGLGRLPMTPFETEFVFRFAHTLSASSSSSYSSDSFPLACSF